jgi:hypothetical protein
VREPDRKVRLSICRRALHRILPTRLHRLRAAHEPSAARRSVERSRVPSRAGAPWVPVRGFTAINGEAGGASRDSRHDASSTTVTAGYCSRSCLHQSAGSSSLNRTALNLRVGTWAVCGWISTMCRVRLQRTTPSSGPGASQLKEQTGHFAIACGRGHGPSLLRGPDDSPCTWQYTVGC